MGWESILTAVAGPLVKEMFSDDAPNYQSQIDSQQAFAREQADKNTALQREFAQHGIRWRVEDAKAAGLHPMYALTGGGAAFAPNPIVMPGAPSQSVSRTGENFGSAMEKGLAAFFAAQQKKDEVIASAVQAVASVAQSSAMSSVPFPGHTPGSEMEWGSYPVPGPANLQNAVDVQDYKPAAVLSRRGGDDSLTPGGGPGGSVHQIAPGFPMILPSSSSGGVSEALESLSESRELMYAYVHRNVEHFGPEWLDKASRYFPVTSLAYRVIENVRNGVSWGEPAWDALGHRAREWDQHFRDKYEHLREVEGLRSRARHREGLPRTFWGTMPRR